MGLSRTVSEINGDFSRKSQNFPTPVYFAPPQTGFPFGLGIGARRQKTRMMWLLYGQKGCEIGLAVYRRVTDEQTDTGRQQRPQSRASRG